MAREKKIVIRCPKCGKRLSSPAKVMGKQGRCTKCQAYFIAPSWKMSLVRRAIQFGTVALLLAIFAGIPYLISRARKIAQLRADEIGTEVRSIEDTISLYELLDEESINNIRSRMDGLVNPEEDTEELVTQVTGVQSKFQEAADALYLKLNPPPDEYEVRLVTRPPEVIGDAKSFLEIGVVDTTDAYCSGEDYAAWAVAYNEKAQKKYVEVLRRKFREKGEFEKTADYEAERKEWEDQRSNRFSISRRELNSLNPSKTIIVDGLKVVDIGDGFNADHNCWSHLRCLFNPEDKNFNINEHLSAVPDKSLDGEEKEYLVHRGRNEFEDVGWEWKVAAQDEFFNLPIGIDEAKSFRTLLDSDSARIAIVVRFVGECRFDLPDIANYKEPKDQRNRNDVSDEDESYSGRAERERRPGMPRGGRRSSSMPRVADSPIAIVLKKFVVYDSASGDVIIKRNLKSPDWSRIAFKPLNP